MSRHSLTGVPDHALLHELAELVARGRTTTAELLEHIAEVDLRKLYLPAAYPSMYHYCIGELNMSEDEATRRIRAARAARDFPAIFDMVADGRLHLTAVLVLAPHLDGANALELLSAAKHKTRAEIECLLANRFPQQDVQTSLTAAPVACVSQPVRVVSPRAPSIAPDAGDTRAHSSALARVVPADGAEVSRVEVPLPVRPRIAPLSPGRYELRTTLDQATHDKLRRVQALLSHTIPSGDIAEVLGRALDLALATLEQRRFATTSRPSARRRSKSARHIPAHVRREVSDRDRYQCTFVSASGKRCAEKRFLEYDHVHPVARGGQPTVENTRLRCRAHNQYEAERIYGAGFMREKRSAATHQRVAAQVAAGERERPSRPA